MPDEFLHPEQDYRGIWPFLFMMGGYVTKERGSDLLEPIDLLKAIYIVDLEHVAMLWDDWEKFERLVSRQQFPTGLSSFYVNRMLNVINLELSLRGAESNEARKFFKVTPSKKVQEIVSSARALSSKRGNALTPFTTRDLLFSICLCEPEMREALKQSGLNMGKLAAMVEEREI